MTLDVRLGREFLTDGGKLRMEIAATGSNVLNRTNYTGFVGNMSSPLFDQATSARAPRRLHITLLLRF